MPYKFAYTCISPISIHTYIHTYMHAYVHARIHTYSSSSHCWRPCHATRLLCVSRWRSCSPPSLAMSTCMSMCPGVLQHIQIVFLAGMYMSMCPGVLQHIQMVCQAGAHARTDDGWIYVVCIYIYIYRILKDMYTCSVYIYIYGEREREHFNCSIYV